MHEPLAVAAALALLVAASEWLVRHTAARHLGSALLVILLTAVAANLGAIPTVGEGSPVYDGIFAYVAPLGIFWLLLQVNLSNLRRAGGPMIVLFFLGALGTTIGAATGLWVAGGEDAFGESTFALGGMFVGTYVGGSANFNAIALEYGVAEDGLLFAGASVVDSVYTTIWMAATVVLPRLLVHRWPAGRAGSEPSGSEHRASRASAATPSAEAAVDPATHDVRSTSPAEVAILLALGAATVHGSGLAAAWFAERGVHVPAMLFMTTAALAFAQVPAIARLGGAHLLGMTAVLFFLAVIGALCDLRALRGIGELGTHLFVLAGVTILVHGTVVFLGARLLRLDPFAAAVASQAGVGGGTSALALARSLGRPDLVLPGILVGSLGQVVGNYLGFGLAEWLR